MPETLHRSETGMARWRIVNSAAFGSSNIRLAISPTISAPKTPILYVLNGVLHTELDDDRKITLTPGTGYQVADNDSAHHSFTETGARLLIVG